MAAMSFKHKKNTVMDSMVSVWRNKMGSEYEDGFSVGEKGADF
jgi:hypothetical protein